MSPQLLSRLRATERATRRLHWRVRRFYGDDGTRYPRDYYAPLDQLTVLTTRLAILDLLQAAGGA